MSILSRFAANRHLDDSNLAEIWSAAAADGRSATHPHLTSCAHCRSRYAAFSQWLEDLRFDAHAEAEEAFPAERLAAQHNAIFRRLEALERPARVIAFPKFSRPATSSRRITHRWVATAAAAGLVIGLAAGQVFNLKQALDRPVQPVPGTPMASAAPSPSRPTVQPIGVSDEALFYGDSDDVAQSAVYMPALDALTPRARDDVFRPR